MGITHSGTSPGEQVFNVNIVGPVEVRRPSLPKKIKPVIRKTKPVLKRRRPTPPDKDIKPETLHGEGTGNVQGRPEGVLSDQPGKRTEGPAEGDRNTALPEKEDGYGANIIPRSSLFDKGTIEKFASKGTSTGKGLTFSSEFKNRGYMRMLKERIESVWIYPKEAARQGISGDLYVKFTIKRDGSLGEVEVRRTSGFRALDEAAIKALKDCSPYWPLPEDWEKDTLEIDGHFIYIFGSTFVM